MPTTSACELPNRHTSVLILSSLVAASQVGGSAQAAVLAARGIDAMLVPTVLFGRHPGLGPPGGAPVSTDVFAGVLGGVEAAGEFARLDAVIAGYFADPDQVRITARAIDRVRRAAPRALVIVDPIMGDEIEGLYVPPPVAEAIAAHLVARADLIAPNLWELERLAGRAANDPAAVVAAARALGRPALVSSVRSGGKIAVVYADGTHGWVASHRLLAGAPKGTGDRLTVLFTAARLEGATPREALESAVRDVAAMAAGEALEVEVESLP
jgi:pyridoxine kinase